MSDRTYNGVILFSDHDSGAHPLRIKWQMTVKKYEDGVGVVVPLIWVCYEGDFEPSPIFIEDTLYEVSAYFKNKGFIVNEVLSKKTGSLSLHVEEQNPCLDSLRKVSETLQEYLGNEYFPLI